MDELEKCDICGWPLSVTARGLVCLNEANHTEGAAALTSGDTDE